MVISAADPIKIFLAEDDEDDREFFKEALKNLPIQTELTILKDGEELMAALDTCIPPPPFVIFLDLNMPRKNGFECLTEMRQIAKLRKIPIIILSTSDNEDAINTTYSLGANFYIRKPRSFAQLKKVIELVLTVELAKGGQQITKEKYLLAIT